MTEQRNRSSEAAVDLPELLVRVDNDHDLLRELIGIFNEEFPRLLQALRQSVASADVKQVEATSHALKGMLSGLSASRAAAGAARLEQMGREGKTSGLTEALTLLEREVADLLPELDGYTTKLGL
jgi:HPt (histidine-containing phosphotransfer) domain-containing protein